MKQDQRDLVFCDAWAVTVPRNTVKREQLSLKTLSAA